MRYDTERQILDGLRAFVQDIITDALSDTDIPPRASAAPVPQPTSPTSHSKHKTLSPMQARIMSAVRAGYRTVPEIAREIDGNADSVRVQLGRLAQGGILRRVARGVYEVAR